MLKIFCFSVIIIIAAGCSRSSSVQKEKELQSLLDKKDYFRLRTTLLREGEEISEQKKIYFRAYVRNAFNDNKNSADDIETLFNQYASSFSDSTKGRLLEIQSDNYFKTFQYAKSAGADSELLNHYQKVLDTNQVKDIKNDLLVRNALYNIPSQQLTITTNDTIQWTKDKIGLMEIPVRKGDSVYSCIFDTRANISSITKTYAAKLGLKMLDVSFDVGSGMTGITFKTSLGIADSIYIGNILVRNVVFQVMPDEIFHFASIQFSINVIIGYPIIQQLKEIHIYQDGKMIVPEHSSKKDLNNLAMDGLSPVLFVKTDDDTIGFHFDSGATSSDFYSTFFSKYKTKIYSRAKLKTIETGGAGGSLKMEIYEMDSLDLYIGDKKATLKNVSIHTKPIDTHNNEKFYGNLGQDLVGQFKEMILNFEDMYIEFK
jgi:hypothetical protein